MRELLRELTALPGVSGREEQVREFIIRQIEGHCAWQVDPLGNLLVEKKGSRPAAHRVQFSAHMDEVGFLITYLEEDGTLRFDAVGGVDARIAAGKPVLVGQALLPGVIGVKPIHLLSKEERAKAPQLEDLAIDIGCTSRAEAEALVQPGEPVVFLSDFTPYGEGFLKAKALDDRAGCALLIRMIQSELPYDCLFSFTVQEETGCTGGRTAAYTLRPEIAVAVETTTAGDLAGAEGRDRVCRLGAGPVVSFMDRGTVYDAGLYRRIFRLAAERQIPCQAKEKIAGGNESRSLQTAAAGARVAAVSLPCRYLHSPGDVIQEADLESTYRLLMAMAEDFCGA